MNACQDSENPSNLTSKNECVELKADKSFIQNNLLALNAEIQSIKL
jgi:hypothetical protein